MYSLLPECQFFLGGMKIYHALYFTNRKDKLLVIVNKGIPSKYIRNFIFQIIYRPSVLI